MSCEKHKHALSAEVQPFLYIARGNKSLGLISTLDFVSSRLALSRWWYKFIPVGRKRFVAGYLLTYCLKLGVRD